MDEDVEGHLEEAFELYTNAVEVFIKIVNLKQDLDLEVILKIIYLYSQIKIKLVKIMKTFKNFNVI